MLKDVMLVSFWILKEAMMNLDEKESSGNDPLDNNPPIIKSNLIFYIKLFISKK